MGFNNPLRDPDGNPVAPIVVLVVTKKHADAIADALATATPESKSIVAGIIAGASTATRDPA